MTDLEFRLAVTERNVQAGRQDPRDLDEIKNHGFVTKPIDWLRQMNIDAAREIDAKYKPRRIKQ